MKIYGYFFRKSGLKCSPKCFVFIELHNLKSKRVVSSFWATQKGQMEKKCASERLRKTKWGKNALL